MSHHAGGAHNLLTTHIHDRFFYDYETQTLTMSVTTKLHAAGANQFYSWNQATLLGPPLIKYTMIQSDSSRATPYTEENEVMEDGKTRLNRKMQVPDSWAACVMNPKYQFRVRHAKDDDDDKDIEAEDNEEHEDNEEEEGSEEEEDGEEEKEAAPFTAPLYSLEVAHSEALGHALYKVSPPV